MKKQFIPIIAASLLAAFSFKPMAFAQQGEPVKQESLDWYKLRVKPTVSIYIPYVDQLETAITGNVNIEASYDLTNIADVTAAVHFGSFSGVSAGGTLHFSDKIVNKSTKFNVASYTSGRTETTSYYQVNSDYRRIIGPTAHVRAGKFGDSGFYMRLDCGLDRQTYSHAYYRGFASNKNGFSSLKLLGTIAKFNQAEMQKNMEEKYVSRMGAGALVSYLYERRPWKRLTWYLGLDAGYMKVFGAEDLQTEFVKFEVNKANYILEMKGGLSFGL